MKMYEVHRFYNPRLIIFYLIFGLLLLFLVIGLGYRQIIQRNQYREKEKIQNLRRILNPGTRGNIFDREGRLLVGNRPRFSTVIYLNELRDEFRKEYIRLVKNLRDTEVIIDRDQLKIDARYTVVQQFLNTVNQILDRSIKISRYEIERHFSQRLLLPLTLYEDLSEEEFALLIEKIPVDAPIQMLTDSSRYYPYNYSAAHTLGYVTSTKDIAGDSLPGENLTTFKFKGKTGRSGLERKFDEKLQGKIGSEIWVVDPSGYKYERIVQHQSQKGNDIYVSLDIDLQIAAERALNTKVGSVVAIDIKSGEVLALANSPSYDLNSLSPFITFDVHDKITEIGAWLNRAIQGRYPPGSSFKILSTIAGMRADSINSDLIIDCSGSFLVGNRKFHCHKRAGHGKVNLTKAIAQSCNIFFYETGLKTGIKLLSKTAREFGFDKPTGIELLNETRGMIVPDPAWKKRKLFEKWYPGDTANLSIGQGYLLVTPLQMATFTASFARKETQTRPTLIYNTNNDIDSIDHGGKPIPLSDGQYSAIVVGMEQAASIGTARLVRIPGIRIAAKTGTAQLWSKGKEVNTAWFICFAPVEKPEIALVVTVEGIDPNDNYHGGSTAAPIGKKVLELYFAKKKNRLVLKN